MPTTVVTWNLQGGTGTDVRTVAHHLAEAGADLVFLQEVSRRDATAIGRMLGCSSVAWAFKHWPLVRPAEGMAVLGRGQPVAVTSRAVAHPLRWWSWRRRIVQQGTVHLDGTSVVVVHAHLSPHRAGRARVHEVETLLGQGDDGRLLLVGDLNEGPGGLLATRLARAGLHDAWTGAATRSGDGPTNWSGDRNRPPDQRLDYVFHGATITVARAAVPSSGPEGWTQWATVSDHLPLTVEVSSAEAG